MSLIFIKRATRRDLSTIMALIDHAKEQLKAAGSPQWQDGYPDLATLTADVDAQHCWLLDVDGQVAGTATMIIGDDPNYQHIEDGQWQNNQEPYATIHRIAIGPGFRGQHLSHYFFSNLISAAYREGVRNFRVDTHQQNQQMQAIATTFGYKYRGTIYVDDGPNGARRAYELNLD
ncbi:acetyltransferase [Levilactobacillus paucivorans]|uniref:Acetyltransferase n=1 Tax=Levilactobacillus paucivorans TaxID=616990 RepID=A0A0R2LXB8_9LACO|nr:GNAT family N-acetyltransferase [Levilactobacillus paucivorans]KRO04700.1 acetyltransferase [Levilactobacillus paucivorans]